MGGKPGTPPVGEPLDLSGFGGWVDEKIEVLREAAPLLVTQRSKGCGRQKSHPQHLTIAHLNYYVWFNLLQG
jgi:hypothetical protein